MPKMKTNRLASKKIRVGGNGRIKRAQAGTSHLTAKMSPKRIRNLRKRVNVDSTNARALRGMLPYSVKG
jgi:large subunit ribosomal protein L35